MQQKGQTEITEKQHTVQHTTDEHKNEVHVATDYKQ